MYNDHLHTYTTHIHAPITIHKHAHQHTHTHTDTHNLVYETNTAFPPYTPLECTSRLPESSQWQML